MANQLKVKALKQAFEKKRIRRAPRLRKVVYPMAVEKKYDRDLLELTKTAYLLIEKHLVPELNGLAIESARERGEKLDAASGDVKKIMREVRIEFSREYTKAEITELARRTGKSVDVWNERQMNGSLGAVVDIDLFGDEPWLDKKMSAFTAENVNLISSLSGDFFDDVETRAMRMLDEGVRWETIADEIFDRYGVTQSRANLIARDQIGKLQGQLVEERQKDLGLTHYFWRTAGDGRVRESHQANANKKFAWSDAPPTGHPGEDYQCRCYAEPDLSEYITP